MRLTHFFIDRPRFATVLSIFVTAFGLGAFAILPVARYPEVVPPTVQVAASYPGASAETVSRTVATPLEQQTRSPAHHGHADGLDRLQRGCLHVIIRPRD